MEVDFDFNKYQRMYASGVSEVRFMLALLVGSSKRCVIGNYPEADGEGGV